MDLVRGLGRTGLGFFHYIFMIVGLFYLSVKVIWTNRDLGHRDFLRQVFLQIYFTGVQAMGPVIVVALGVGTFSIVAAVGGIGGFVTGAENIGRLITVLVMRELAPLLTGGIVIVRSITAIATELGFMRVHREIEALEAMGISPVRQLITPRIFGGLISFLGLNVLFTTVAIFCGFVMAKMLVAIPADMFFSSVFRAVTPGDLLGMSVKVGVGGTSIFVIACYHGMSVEGSLSEVPVAVSKASLNSLVFLLALVFTVSLLTLLHYEAGHFLGGFL